MTSISYRIIFIVNLSSFIVKSPIFKNSKYRPLNWDSTHAIHTLNLDLPKSCKWLQGLETFLLPNHAPLEKLCQDELLMKPKIEKNSPQTALKLNFKLLLKNLVVGLFDLSFRGSFSCTQYVIQILSSKQILKSV